MTVATPQLWAFTDAMLLDGLVLRRVDVLAEVFHRHGARMTRIAERVCNADAGDVVQDVMLRLWDEPTRFVPSRGPLGAYLAMRTRGRSIDVLRSRTSQRDRELRVHAAEVALTSPHAPAAESTALLGEVAVQVRSLLEALRPVERESIVLAYFGGMTYREVAAAVDRPEGTVKGQIRSGLARLRELIEQAGAGTSLTVT